MPADPHASPHALTFMGAADIVDALFERKLQDVEKEFYKLKHGSREERRHMAQSLHVRLPSYEERVRAKLAMKRGA